MNCTIEMDKTDFRSRMFLPREETDVAKDLFPMNILDYKNSSIMAEFVIR
jgi:hypothetical protein